MVNYLVVLQDARFVSGQVRTWAEAAAECQRVVTPGSWYVRGTCAVMFVLSDGTVHMQGTALDKLAIDADLRDHECARIERSMREALIAR